MGRFVVHGTILEEPIRKTLSSGMDCVTIVIEERVVTASLKELVNTYSVDFIGKASKCVPEDVSVANCCAVIMGDISSREYNGRYYNDLRGNQLTIVSNAPRPTPAQASTPKDDFLEDDGRSIEDLAEDNDEIDLPDDDLPF